MRGLDIASSYRLFSRVGIAIAAACLLLASVVHAAENNLVQDMPRGYLGEFRWDGDSTVQNVVITLDSVRALIYADGEVDAEERQRFEKLQAALSG